MQNETYSKHTILLPPVITIGRVFLLYMHIDLNGPICRAFLFEKNTKK